VKGKGKWEEWTEERKVGKAWEKMVGGKVKERAIKEAGKAKHKAEDKVAKEVAAMWEEKMAVLRLGKDVVVKGEEAVEWTEFDGEGVRRVMEKAKGEVERWWAAVQAKEKVTVSRTEQVVERKEKQAGKGKQKMSVDVMGWRHTSVYGQVSKGWVEMKRGDSDEAREEAVKKVEEFGAVLEEVGEWECRTGKREGEKGWKLERPEWVAYAVVGDEQWRWREREVLADGELGEWQKERRWGWRTRGRQVKHQTEAEKKKAKEKQDAKRKRTVTYKRRRRKSDMEYEAGARGTKRRQNRDGERRQSKWARQ
jgi:hypothetical protein